MPNELATGKDLVAIQEETFDVVIKKMKAKREGGFVFPEGFSIENALAGAFNMLQDVKAKEPIPGSKEKKEVPALSYCSNTSITQALFKMCLLGLDVTRDQGYFIAYGKKLVFQASYFGDIVNAKRHPEVKNVGYQVVWEGDEFKYEIEGSTKRVTKHKQDLDNIGGKAKGAYCTVFLEDGTTDTDIMTMAQIQKSWSMGTGGDSVHKKFDEESIKKTIVRRGTKKYRNSHFKALGIIKDVEEDTPAVDFPEDQTTVTVEIPAPKTVTREIPLALQQRGEDTDESTN
jgi:recombination protein RecT